MAKSQTPDLAISGSDMLTIRISSYTKYDHSILAFAIQNPRILAVFANPKSRDWSHLNPSIRGLQKFVKNVFFECQIQISIL